MRFAALLVAGLHAAAPAVAQPPPLAIPPRPATRSERLPPPSAEGPVSAVRQLPQRGGEARLDALEHIIERQQRQLAVQQGELQALSARLSAASGADPRAVDGRTARAGDAAPPRPAVRVASAKKQPGPPGVEVPMEPDEEESVYPGSAAPPAPTVPTPGPYVIGSDRMFSGSWTNNGPVWTSKNGDFTFHPRAVSQLDFIAMKDPGPGIGVPPGAGTLDSVEFRRLRMGADGTMWEVIDYAFEFDFAMALQNVDPAAAPTPTTGLRSIGTVNGVPQNQAGNTAHTIQPTTIFLVFKELPIFQNVRVGNQQDWMSLEHIESARFLDFMERSPLMDAFNGPNNNGYTPGISAYRTFFDQYVGWQLGAYKNNAYDSGFTYDIGNTNYTYGTRLMCTPYYDRASNGRYMVHLAVGGTVRTFNNQPTPNMDGTNVRIRSRGDLRLTASTLDPNFADTGNFYATGQGLVNPEIAVVWGPLLIQAEYETSYMINAAAQKGGASLGNVRFDGGYAQALYFLTGENREYNRLGGFFNRVVPYSNAHLVRGAGFSTGAWQIGARYDWLNLNSHAVSGGQNQDLTLGLNWFLNPNARFQFNHVLSWINNSVATTFPGTVGSLNGSRFTGKGLIQTFGCRMDFNW